MLVLFITLHVIAALLAFGCGYYYNKAKRYKKDYELEHMRYVSVDALSHKRLEDIQHLQQRNSQLTRIVLNELTEIFAFGRSLGDKARHLYLSDKIGEPVFTLVNEFVEKGRTEFRIPSYEEFNALCLVKDAPIFNMGVKTKRWASEGSSQGQEVKERVTRLMTSEPDTPALFMTKNQREALQKIGVLNTETFGNVNVYGDPMLIPGYHGEVSRESSWGMQEQQEESAALVGIPERPEDYVDIHTQTAAKIFNVPEEQVTKEQRNAAKAVNFNRTYGDDFELPMHDMGASNWPDNPTE